MAGKGKLIEKVLSGDILMPNGMFSPSRLAAENLQQGKGSFEQMRKALISAGAKEDELVWSGFDKHFGGKDKITKEEARAFLADNTDLVDDMTLSAEGVVGAEVDESDLASQFVEGNLVEETKYYRTDWLPERLSDEYTEVSELEPAGLRAAMEARDWYVNDPEGFLEEYKGSYVNNDDVSEMYLSKDDAIENAFGDPEELAREGLSNQANEMGTEELYEALGIEPSGAGDTIYSDYFTPGLTNYREDLYTSADPYGIGTRQAGDPHWGNVADSTPLMHRRSADTQTPDGQSVFHVGELQSDWAQGARGHARPTPQQEIEIAGAEDARLGMIGFESAAKRLMSSSGMPLQRPFDRAELGYLNDMDRLQNQQRPIMTSRPTEPAQYKPAIRALSEQPRFTQQSVMSDLGDSKDEVDAFNELRDGNGLLRPGYTDPNASEYPNMGYLRANTSIPDGGLPFGSTPQHQISDSFEAEFGPRIDQSRGVLDLAERFGDDDLAAAPYTNKTDRWVDYMLKRSLIDAAHGGDEFLTIGTGDMAKAMTGGQVDGQGEFYDKIVPGRLKKVAKQTQNPNMIGPQVGVSPVEILTGDTSESVNGLRITPAMREKIKREGLPSWAHPAATMMGGGLAAGMYQNGGGQQASAPWRKPNGPY